MPFAASPQVSWTGSGMKPFGQLLARTRLYSVAPPTLNEHASRPICHGVHALCTSSSGGDFCPIPNILTDLNAPVSAHICSTWSPGTSRPCPDAGFCAASPVCRVNVDRDIIRSRCLGRASRSRDRARNSPSCVPCRSGRLRRDTACCSAAAIPVSREHSNVSLWRATKHVAIV